MQDNASKIVPLTAGQGGGHVDILMIHALLDSLFRIFSTMANMRITPGVPVPKTDKTARGDVSGIMQMVADQAQGSIALSFPLPAIRELSEKLLDEAIDGLGREAQDLVGELTNMLVGGAKKVTAEVGYDFDMRTPQLCSGSGHEIAHAQPGQTVLLPIRMTKSEFYLELNFL
ncbi:MAG: chemotaxis protein CheX [Gammaproteobacteria bacterium]|nr:chemotaxis protein CheX [Gammaproteobacteria bacterium]